VTPLSAKPWEAGNSLCVRLLRGLNLTTMTEKMMFPMIRQKMMGMTRRLIRLLGEW
jgi:hypothetical protein